MSTGSESTPENQEPPAREKNSLSPQSKNKDIQEEGDIYSDNYNDFADASAFAVQAPTTNTMITKGGYIPHQTFYYFLSLPKSIRIKIWERALPGKRILTITHDGSLPPRNPILFHVSCEARAVARSFFKRELYDDVLISGTNQRRYPRIYINPITDIILIDLNKATLRQFLRSFDDETGPSIERMGVIGFEELFGESQARIEEDSKCLLSCSLKTLYLVFSDEGSRSRGEEAHLTNPFLVDPSDWPTPLEQEYLVHILKGWTAGYEDMAFQTLAGVRQKVEMVRQQLETIGMDNWNWPEPKVLVRAVRRT